MIIATTSLPDTFGYYCSNFLNFLFNNPFIQSNPLAIVFLVSVIPQIFTLIPKTELIIPILTNGTDASGIIIASTAGNIVSELILYFLAKKGLSILIKKEKREDKEIRHFLHKYSWSFFIVAPFIPLGTDGLIIVAGLKRVRLLHILGPMTIGFALKNIIFVFLVLQGLYFLPQILKICS